MKSGFNTTGYVRDLTIAGFSRARAQTDGRISTSRDDLAAAEQRLQGRIAAAADELRADLQSLRRAALFAAAAVGVLAAVLLLSG